MSPRLIDSAVGERNSGEQRVNDVDRTHRVLASGKLELQKKF